MASHRIRSISNLFGTWLRAQQSYQQSAFLKTSSACQSSLKNTKKKLVKPVIRNAKSSIAKHVVDIFEKMTVSDLAKCLNKSADEIFEALNCAGVYIKFESPKSEIDIELIKKVVTICGCKYKMGSTKVSKKEEKVVVRRKTPDPAKMVRRPPVVTIMGHVDHGKTTLLDSLRNSNIVAQEFGGITQHIGAFSVNVKDGESVTFLDTPGHAAFSSMRARGANITDIVILVIAADDGIMMQTVESLKFAQEAGVPIIVAINKVDKPNADVERTKKELAMHGLVIEECGGDVQTVCISALKGMNLDLLLESILAQAEIMELKADPTSHVEAVCVESKTDLGRGKVATTLIQHGTLKRGQFLVAGDSWAKVRGLFNEKGQPISSAGPGTPVEVIGWKSLPSAGDKIIEVETEQDAKKLVEEFEREEKEKKINVEDAVIKKKMDEERQIYNELRKKKLERGQRLGAIFRKIRTKESGPEDTTPKLNIIIKGDVDGSVEAILDIIDTYSSKMCDLNILSYGVGPVTENDVELAQTFDGVIYTFNTKALENSSTLAKTHGVPILKFNIIYKLISSLVEKLNEKLPEVMVDEVVGEANVLANFTVTEGKKKILVAGCRCTKGQLVKKKMFKLIRDEEVLMEGDLTSLKHFKAEVGTIKNDMECGMSFSNQSVTPQPGDKIVCFEKVGKKQEIDWKLDFI